jgi:hypothetical protein
VQVGAAHSATTVPNGLESCVDAYRAHDFWRMYLVLCGLLLQSLNMLLPLPTSMHEIENGGGIFFDCLVEIFHGLLLFVAVFLPEVFFL